jgi:protein gp37
MADGTKIEWTDMTWNVVNGCTVVSPGCKHCYAMKQAHRFPVRQGLTTRTAGGMVWTGEVRFNEKVLLEPIRLKRPRKIFVCADGDLFHENVPSGWIDLVFAVMKMAPQHTFQVLTKRPERARKYLTDQSRERSDGRGTALEVIWEKAGTTSFDRIMEGPWPLPNVWLGTSVEDQKRADERIPILLETTPAVRWLSCEPLLGHVDISRWLKQVDWVVVGGESGPGARPMHPAWARSLRDQCAAAGVPFLFKQWGDWRANYSPDRDGPTHFVEPDGRMVPIESGIEWASGSIPMRRIGKKAAGRLLDGVEHNGYPA